MATVKLRMWRRDEGEGGCTCDSVVKNLKELLVFGGLQIVVIPVGRSRQTDWNAVRMEVPQKALRPCGTKQYQPPSMALSTESYLKVTSMFSTKVL